MVRLKRASLAILAIIAISSLGMSGVASAHGQDVCAFTSATGLPALVNNVEGKGGTWTIDPVTKYWTGSAGPDGDPMKAQLSDGFGHTPDQGLVQDRRGLYYPVTDPNTGHLTIAPAPAPYQSLPSFVGDHFNWTNVDQCNNNGAPANTKGVGVGYCGRSVGLGLGTVGTGTGAHNVITKWESAGSQLYLVDPTSAGTLNAQPNPPGSANGSCLNGTGVQFNLNGVLLHLA